MSLAILQNKKPTHKNLLDFYILGMNNWKLKLKNKTILFTTAKTSTFSQVGITGTRCTLLPKTVF